MDRYVIQRLDGYTDGKESWIQVRNQRTHFPSKEAAGEAMRDLAERNPKARYRVRKARQRKRPARWPLTTRWQP